MASTNQLAQLTALIARLPHCHHTRHSHTTHTTAACSPTPPHLRLTLASHSTHSLSTCTRSSDCRHPLGTHRTHHTHTSPTPHHHRHSRRNSTRIDRTARNRSRDRTRSRRRPPPPYGQPAPPQSTSHALTSHACNPPGCPANSFSLHSAPGCPQVDSTAPCTSCHLHAVFQRCDWERSGRWVGRRADR